MTKITKQPFGRFVMSISTQVNMLTAYLFVRQVKGKTTRMLQFLPYSKRFFRRKL